MLSLAIDMRGFEIAELAHDLNDPYIGAYITGFRQPDMDTIERFVKVLKFPIAFFFRVGQRETKNRFTCVSIEQRLDDSGNLHYEDVEIPAPAVVQLRLPLFVEVE
jgi:hypothetical protein